MTFDKPIRRLAPTVEAWPAQTETDENTFRFVFSNEKVGRDGFIVQNRAINHENYDRNPVVLFAHDDTQPPIGRGTNIDTSSADCTIDITFAPRDILPFAGTIRDLVAGKWLRAVSLSWQPLDYKRSSDPDVAAIFTSVDMLEVSIVPLPALPSALLDARSHGVDTAPLYEWAERLLDKGDMTLVARGELEQLRRAAKMPTKAPVHTQEKQAMAKETTDRAIVAKHRRAIDRAPKVPTFRRGLCELANLAYILHQLGYAHEASEYEAEVEGDDSQLPAMIGESLATLGAAVKAMAAEEVDELIANTVGDDEEDDDEDFGDADRAFVRAGKTAGVRAWRRGIALARAGKALSKSNGEKLEEAQDHHVRAWKHHQHLGEHHEAVGDHVDKAMDHHERATKTLSAFGDHLRTIQNASSPQLSSDALDKAVQYHRAASADMEKIGDEHHRIKDCNGDVGDAHSSLGRSLKAAQRCVRAVLTGAVTSESDESDADDVKDSEAAKEEKARKARAARAAELARKEPITLDLD
jgi:hypothetical protein